MANNLVVGSETDLVKIITTPTNFTWSGNIMYPEVGISLGMEATENQIKVEDPLLEYADSLWLLSSASPAIDAALINYLNIAEDIQGQKRYATNDVGADEYSLETANRKPLTQQDVGPFAEDIVSLPEVNKTPESFILLYNYPNPFNSSTTLEYFFETHSYVKLEIFNVLGQKVATLLNGRQMAGTHQVQWHAGNMATGIYLAVLKTNDTTKTIKLVLMK
jgi:hypothetical protein